MTSNKNQETKKLTGTSADCPSTAYLFDWTECSKCILFDDCETKEDRDGCHFGVSEED